MSGKKNTNRRRRWPKYVVVAIVVLALGGWWTMGAFDEEGGSWTSVELDDLPITVELDGELAAVETSKIGPPQLRDTWKFKIARMAPEGSEARKGMPILFFDTSELEQRLQQEMAEADSARKRIEKAESELQMNRQQDGMSLAEAEARRRKAALQVDLPPHLSKENELATARLDLELAEKEALHLDSRVASRNRSAEAQLAALRDQQTRAEQQVAEIQTSIQEMRVKAPRDGTVIYVSDWQGNKKKSGDNCWRGEHILELPDLSLMKGTGQVHEADAGKVVEDQIVRLRLDAHSDLEFTGRVSSIWRTVQKESWRSPKKVVKMEIELNETDPERMRPGMRFRGEIEVERIAECLSIPLEAVFRTHDGPVVFRKTWLGSEPVQVRLGRRNKERVEVLEGLEGGDRVSLTDLRDKESST